MEFDIRRIWRLQDPKDREDMLALIACAERVDTGYVRHESNVLHVINEIANYIKMWPWLLEEATPPGQKINDVVFRLLMSGVNINIENLLRGPLLDIKVPRIVLVLVDRQKDVIGFKFQTMKPAAGRR